MSNDTNDSDSPPALYCAIDGRMAIDLEHQVEDAPNPQGPERFRTVADCATGELLQQALLTCGTADADWKTPHIDASTSLPHSFDDEVRRLLELKEYYVLDSEQEEKFERITGLASRIFDVPIALIRCVLFEARTNRLSRKSNFLDVSPFTAWSTLEGSGFSATGEGNENLNVSTITHLILILGSRTHNLIVVEDWARSGRRAARSASAHTRSSPRPTCSSCQTRSRILASRRTGW